MERCDRRGLYTTNGGVAVEDVDFSDDCVALRAASTLGGSKKGAVHPRTRLLARHFRA